MKQLGRKLLVIVDYLLFCSLFVKIGFITGQTTYLPWSII